MNRKHDGASISFQPRIRRGAFFEACWDHGCRNFSVYNRTYISSTFSNPTQEYWQVINHVSLWPVMGERQIEISGVDAANFVQYLTCRDMSNCAVNQCKYALLLNTEGGIVCDPIILRLEKNKFWISTSDCDLELWIKGVNVNSGLNVNIHDANVSLLQIQGPKSSALLTKMFGEQISQLKYYWLKKLKFEDIDLIISRTGWSGELGYEIYLSEFDKGTYVFNQILEAGKEFSISVGAVNQARRIESGILSWGVDMSQNENPFQVGLGRLVETETRDNFIGKKAIIKLSKLKQKKVLVGMKLNTKNFLNNETSWNIKKDSLIIGKLTSVSFSPRLKYNIGLGIIDTNYSKIGSKFIVEAYDELVEAEVVPLPFMEKKQMVNAEELAKKFYSN